MTSRTDSPLLDDCEVMFFENVVPYSGCQNQEDGDLGVIENPVFVDVVVHHQQSVTTCRSTIRSKDSVLKSFLTCPRDLANLGRWIAARSMPADLCGHNILDYRRRQLLERKCRFSLAPFRGAGDAQNCPQSRSWSDAARNPTPRLDKKIPLKHLGARGHRERSCIDHLRDCLALQVGQHVGRGPRPRQPCHRQR